MDEILYRLAEQIRNRYHETAHAGLRGGQEDRVFNAGRAEALRETLTLVLADLLGRSPTREETAAWIVGRLPPQAVRRPADAAVVPEAEAAAHYAP